MPKMKLSYNDQSDQVPSMMKIGQDNNLIACTSAVYIENNTKLS